jgi:hypothetical protein
LQVIGMLISYVVGRSEYQARILLIRSGLLLANDENSANDEQCKEG